MKKFKKFFVIFYFMLGINLFFYSLAIADSNKKIPQSLESYNDQSLTVLSDILLHRIIVEPFNLVATIIFLLAIIHTFLAGKFMKFSHKLEKKHKNDIEKGKAQKKSKHIGAGILHFLGEVEAIFGFWVLFLVLAIVIYFDWATLVHYLDKHVLYVEPLFVVVIMTLASTRPILKFSESIMGKFSYLLGGTLGAWWLSILTFGPILGSFITEPAAMTISAILLSQKFYELNPSLKFKYATLGLLFVNVSVGGTLTNFAAPPVLMVADAWGWTSSKMMLDFGWKAIIGIFLSNGFYFFYFKKEMNLLQKKYDIVQLEKNIQEKYCNKNIIEKRFEEIDELLIKELKFDQLFMDKSEKYRSELKTDILSKHKDVNSKLLAARFDFIFDQVVQEQIEEKIPGILSLNKRPIYENPRWDQREDKVPWWIILIHGFFLLWTVINAHNPALFIGGFLFFIAFAEASSNYQNKISLKPALLVGFFLAGLVIHGNLQSWWIAPVLSRLSEIPLLIGAVVLTSFNDNAAITYLTTLVPNFSDDLKYIVVSGAVSGGGLTVIANAPNPAGQSILKKYFANEISPLSLLISALIPTIIMSLCFLFFRL